MTRLALFLLGAGVLAAMLDRPGLATPATQLVAHRGGALLWPENSLLAFARAVELGTDYIEFDVHLSRDGEPVVIHDPSLERTTTGAGPVRQVTLGGLRALRLKDPSGRVTDEPLPTLDEVVALAARARRQMLLEIKLDERGQRYPGIEEKVLDALDRHGMAAATVVMSSGGQCIPLTVQPVVYCYGENTLVWEPALPIGSPPPGDTAYDVTVSGVEINGELRNFTYQVVIFDPGSLVEMFADRHSELLDEAPVTR